MEVLSTIFHQAQQKGIKVFFNPGKGELKHPAKLKALLDDVDILSLNREEMQLLVEGEELEELARHALHYVSVAIVSDGPNGVVATDGKTIVRAGMYQDVKVVDRTGAGDGFGSGFLSQWAQGKSLKDSIIFASANSTSIVTKIGAKAGILHEHVKLHDMPIHEKELR
jgi:ribokinase